MAEFASVPPKSNQLASILTAVRNNTFRERECKNRRRCFPHVSDFKHAQRKTQLITAWVALGGITCEISDALRRVFGEYQEAVVI